MKRLSAILMCVILVLSMTVVAVSADGTHNITITDGKNDETYTAYKIFDVTYSASSPKSYSYTIAGNSGWFSVVTTGKDTDSSKAPTDPDTDGVFYAHGLKFTPVATSSDPTVYNVEQVTDATSSVDAFNAETFAAYLYKNVSSKIEAGHVTYSDTAKSISVTDDGYYFVTTSFGTLCDLNTTEPNVEITEKNSDHTVDKAVKEDSDSNYYDADDAQIGDTVDFHTTVSIKKGAKNLVLHDKMDAGLTPDVSTVTVSSPAGLVKDTHYTVAADTTNNGFTVTFVQTYLDSLTADNTDVIVTYSAQLNENAAIGGSGNVNRTYLTYGDNQSTTEDTTTTYTYEFNVLKTDNSDPANKLAGAKFELYYSNGTDKVQFVQTATAGTYRVATPEEIADDTVTKITEIETVANADIKYIGLDADTYILKETKAPDGFNILPQTITVQIAGVSGTTKVEKTAAEGSNPATYFDNGTVFQRSDGQSSTVNNPSAAPDGNEKTDKTITVVNTKGGLLPTTGALGTTIFYTVGGILVIGAVILLISRKRMKKSA